eukprot:scaffold79914_cov16-Tisochrysis_lutea.AAC.1
MKVCASDKDKLLILEFVQETYPGGKGNICRVTSSLKSHQQMKITLACLDLRTSCPEHDLCLHLWLIPSKTWSLFAVAKQSWRCQEMRMIGNNCKFHPRGFLPHSFTHKHRKQHLPPYERQVGVMDKTLIKEEKKGLSSHHTGGRPHIHLCDFIRISSWNMTGTKHVRCSQVAGNKKKMTTPPQIVRLRKARQAEKEDRSSKEKESMVKPKRLEFQVAGWAVPDAFTRKAKHASHGETSKKGIERCKYAIPFANGGQPDAHSIPVLQSSWDDRTKGSNPAHTHLPLQKVTQDLAHLLPIASFDSSMLPT